MKVWKVVLVLAIICIGFTTVVVGGHEDIGFELPEEMEMVCAIPGAAGIVVLLPLSLIFRRFDPTLRAKRKEKKVEKLVEKTQKEYQKANEKEIKKAENEKRRAREAELNAYRIEQQRLDNIPVSAKVITSSAETKTSGGLGGAVVGSLFGGVPGAIVGASVSGKRTTVTGEQVTFAVKYKSGRTGTETVKVGSKRFEELASLLIAEK